MHSAAKALEDSANNTWQPDPLLDVSWWLPQKLKTFQNRNVCEHFTTIFFGAGSQHSLRALPAVGPRPMPAPRAGGGHHRGRDLEAAGALESYFYRLGFD